MRKCIIIIAVLFCAIAVMARPPRHHGPRGGWGPRPYGGYYHRYRGNDGVWLAAGITNIVANGLGIVRTIAAPPAYVTQPVYTTPVVQQPVYQYDAPVVQQPVYTQTQVVQPYYPPRQVIRNVPIYDPWGNIRGYRQVVTYEK